MTIGTIANLEDGLSVRNKLNAAIAAINNEPLNLLELGAVGDGVADDTAAMNAAIAEQNSSGRPIYLPPNKTFRVATNLTTFTNGMSIIGGGKIKATHDVTCLRHFPTGWATGVTERAVGSLSLANWQGLSNHNVTVANMSDTSGLAVGQWVKIGSSTIQIPGPSLNFWFEWSQIRAITTGSNITLDRVLEGHARGLLPGTHINYRLFAFPLTIRPVIVDVGFEADESVNSIYSTVLTGRSPFLMDRGSVNAIIRVRGRRWWNTLVHTTGILSRIDAGWEELPDITDVPTANESLGYGVQCSSGAFGVLATLQGGTCRHGITTTAATLSVYDATRPFDLGLNFYCGSTPASRVSGASGAAYDTHIQSFGARLFGEAIAGIEHPDSDANAVACQDRGFNSTISVRSVSGYYAGFKLQAADTNWGSLGECVTVLDNVESRDVNGGQHVQILGISSVSKATCVLRNPVLCGPLSGQRVGIEITAGFAGRVIVQNPAFEDYAGGRCVSDQSGLCRIEVHGGYVRYRAASSPLSPFHISSSSADRGNGTTGDWFIDGFHCGQLSASSPTGLFQIDSSFNVNVMLGRLLTYLTPPALRSSSSVGAGQLLLSAPYNVGDLVPYIDATGSMVDKPTGRQWKMIGNITAVPIFNGWLGVFLNVSGSNKTLAPASGNCIVVEAGTTVGSVTIANNKEVVVKGDGTNLVVLGDVV